MKTRDAIELANAIGAVMRSNVPRPMTFGFKLALNARALAPIAEAYDAQRLTALKRLAVLDDKGAIVSDANGQATFVGDNQAAYIAILKELADVDVDLKIATISISLCPDDLEPAIVLGLMPMLIDPDADNIVKAA